jgi:hypothetical protein
VAKANTNDNNPSQWKKKESLKFKGEVWTYFDKKTLPGHHRIGQPP